MQLASHGVRAFPGRVSQKLPHAPGVGSSRSIHTPSFLRVAPGRNTQVNTARKLIEQSTTLLNRFFVHLTTPGQLGNTSSAGPLHNTGSLVRSGRTSIQQGYSLPVRHTISRPFGSYHLPKPPTVPRSVFQVGLGTARNFHSTRPIFQNLIENVPVAGRAFCEADLKVRMKEEKRKVKLSKKESSQGKKSKEMIKPVEKKLVIASTDGAAAEFENYFAAPVVPQIITYLLIPLAPTPTARHPLPVSQSPSLLPIPVLLDIHSSYELHSLRVSSIFARLDASQVWTHPGVSCSVYGDPSGLASILKIEFRGWSEAEVRGVIGEAGTGWCVLEEEVDESEVPPSSPILSGVSTPLTRIEGSPSSLMSPELEIDPARSLVLPSLDFSDYQVWSDSGAQSVLSPLILPSRNPVQVDVVHDDYNSDDGLESFDSMSSYSDEIADWTAISSSTRVTEEDSGPRVYMF